MRAPVCRTSPSGRGECNAEMAVLSTERMAVTCTTRIIWVCASCRTRVSIDVDGDIGDGPWEAHS